MDLSPNPSYQLCRSLIFFICFGHLLSSVNTKSANYNTLVYKVCANQTFENQSEPYSQILSSLFNDLVMQSSQSKFFKTTAGHDDDQTPQYISGLFQCRGDLSDGDCHNCVKTLPMMVNNLCPQKVSARVQLSGCYLRYETDGSEPENSGHILLYKACGKSKAVAGGLKEVMEAAFVALEKGVACNNGFYTTNYEGFHVLAQCVGGLGGCDCGECLSNAVEIAKDECENSLSGEIYMDSCFMSYTYTQYDERPKKNPEKKRKSNTRKTVAIVIGAVAALCFGFIFLVFIKSLAKKEDDDY